MTMQRTRVSPRVNLWTVCNIGMPVAHETRSNLWNVPPVKNFTAASSPQTHDLGQSLSFVDDEFIELGGRPWKQGPSEFSEMRFDLRIHQARIHSVLNLLMTSMGVFFDGGLPVSAQLALGGP
jgi:hypothetical protein